MKTFLLITNGLALIVTVLVNYLGNGGIFNGNTMATISDRYANFFTPAGYAFSIWGVIYLALLGFVFFAGRTFITNKRSDPILFRISWLFVSTCLANSIWVIAWLNDYIGLSVIVMVILLVCLLRILLVIGMESGDQPFSRYLFVTLPFALYAGWISVALIANVAAWLTMINWNGWGISAEAWTVIMVIIAGVVNVFVIMTRNLREYGLVGVWALIGISVANDTANGSATVVHTCYIVAVVILFFMVIDLMRGRRLVTAGTARM